MRGIPIIFPRNVNSCSAKYFADPIHNLTSSLFEPEIIGTLATYSGFFKAFCKPIIGITIPSFEPIFLN